MNIATPLNVIEMDEIERISYQTLAPIARKIDEERIYPEEIVRAMGQPGPTGLISGDRRRHRSVRRHPVDGQASETCLSTGFCMWCQDTLAWYIASSEATG